MGSSADAGIGVGVMEPILQIEDVAYVDQKFREIAEYLEKKNVPGTIWRIFVKGYIYEFVCKRREKVSK